MTSPLLTIAIPTYRRAPKLAQQLHWLALELASTAEPCEVIISDNCSPDDTVEVAERWAATAPCPAYVHRGTDNVGALGNIAYCIQAARGEFVWVIGDDDEIAAGTLAAVLAQLTRRPELAGVAIEFDAVGARPLQRCYGFESTTVLPPHALTERVLRTRPWVLAFMSSHVYRTEIARAALRAWPGGVGNLDYQLFITSFVAARGEIVAIADPLVHYATGDNVYETDPVARVRLVGDTAAALARLPSLGYGRVTCARRLAILRHQLDRSFWRGALARPRHGAMALGQLALSFVSVWF